MLQQLRSAVRSLVGFNTETQTLVNTNRNSRIGYVNKHFFSYLPTQVGLLTPNLTSSSPSNVVGDRYMRVEQSSVYWTKEKNARLTEGVAQHKAQSWARVAEFMGDGLSAVQCMNRWNMYLEPQQRGLKSGNWQPDEEERLLELVPQHLIPSYWSTRTKVMTRERTDWKAIGRELGRVAMDCTNKYRLIQKSQMKKGLFTAEEDALIRQRVEEWGDKGNGLWVALEKEMDRADKIIGKRWKLIISKRK